MTVAKKWCLTEAQRRDAADPIAFARARFSLPKDRIYFDGNSLGPLSHAVRQRIAEVTAQQWGEDLITSWNAHQWIDLPKRVGNRIGRLIGASPGQVLCCDSISINLFKLLAGALPMVRGKRQVLSTQDNFPTDLYMVQGLSHLIGQHACRLDLVEESALLEEINDDTGIVLVTEVNFRTGRRISIPELVAKAHAHGALVIVDLAHSAGAVPVHLEAWAVDFAVGCTYKYLNGGPGAPAFVYVAKRHQQQFQQPLFGWLGHAQPFDFSPHYEGAEGISQLLTGTPPIISLAAVDAALDAFQDVDIRVLREKSLGLSEYFLLGLGLLELEEQLRLISPRAAEHRGSQLSFAHDDAYGICQALIERGIIADFRAPNVLRIGFAPLYNTYEEVWQTVETIGEVLAAKEHQDPRWQTRNAVT
ncbi:MAG: kynureninase [Idiomarina sp.]|nr:kynureninase [Idiomarina sp.]